jgi:hypothetical protein
MDLVMPGIAGQYSQSSGGVSLVAERNALETWAQLLEGTEIASLLIPDGLDDHPDRWAALRAIELRPLADDTRVTLAGEAETLTIVGGRAACTLMAAHLRNLARAPYRVTSASVPTHADIEYYDTHPYLAPSDRWLTVELQSDEG